MSDERGGRYFREARFFLAGDKVAAQSHILEARSLMGYMRDMHALGGPPIQVQYTTLQDGTQIKATMMNGQYQAEIVSPFGGDERVVEACRTFRSGLLAIVDESEYTVVDEGGNEVPYERMEWLHASEYQLAVAPLTPPKSPIEAETQHDILGTYKVVFSSAYSGAMRQAVQLLLGMDLKLADFHPPMPATYEYNFGYSGTHGLVRKFDYTDEAPSFWLIRMPAAGYGVLAMDYPVCAGVTKEQRDAGVLWIPEGIVNFPADLDDAITDGRVLELVSSATFAAGIDGYAPLYQECGWAFSLSGHECQTVLYRVDEVSPANFTTYTKRFKVAFTRTATGQGITAEFSAFDRCECLGDKHTVPRYPQGSSLMPFFEAYDLPSTFSGAINAPVHVYYSGDDEQVYRYVVDTSNVAVAWDEGNFFTAEHYRSTAYGDAFPVAGEYTGVAHYPGTIRIYYTLNGAVITDATYRGTGVEYHVTVTLSAPTALPPYLDTGGATYTLTGYINRTDEYVRALLDKQNYPLLMVPFSQREAVYVLDGAKTVFSGYTTYPMTPVAVATGPTVWQRLFSLGTPDASCSDGIHVTILSSVTRPETATYPPVPMYPYSPAVDLYVEALGGGGIGYNTLVGCNANILAGMGITIPGPAPGVVVDSGTEWEGKLRFFSSGGAVDMPFGADAETKIATIVSTAYIELGGSVFLHGWTDGIVPEKHIIFDDINTVDSAHAVTNTAYPMDEIEVWGKVFMGIAN